MRDETVVEDASLGLWDHILPDRYKLILEAEEQFIPYYHVVERFLKSTSFVQENFPTQSKPNAEAEYD